MIYMRGQARDYDAWAAATRDDAWSWPNVLPDFRAHECSLRCEGGGGQRRITAQAASGASPNNVCAGTSSMRSREAAGAGGLRAHRRLQHRRQRRRQLLRREPARRPARELGEGFPETGALARQSHGVDARAHRKAASSTRDVNGALRCTGATLIRNGERVRSARDARSHPRARARSARRSCCSFRASGPQRCCANTASTCATTRPASARICRITCRSGRCSRCSGVRTLNVMAGEFLGPPRHRARIRAAPHRAR